MKWKWHETHLDTKGNNRFQFLAVAVGISGSGSKSFFGTDTKPKKILPKNSPVLWRKLSIGDDTYLHYYTLPFLPRLMVEHECRFYTFLFQQVYPLSHFVCIAFLGLYRVSPHLTMKTGTFWEVKYPINCKKAQNENIALVVLPAISSLATLPCSSYNKP